MQKQHSGQQPAPSQSAPLSLRASGELQFSFLDCNCLSQFQLCTPALKGSTIPQCSSVTRMLLNCQQGSTSHIFLQELLILWSFIQHLSQQNQKPSSSHPASYANISIWLDLQLEIKGHLVMSIKVIIRIVLKAMPTESSTLRLQSWKEETGNDTIVVRFVPFV